MTDDSGWWWASLLGAAATVTVVPLIIAVNILSGEGGTGELHHSEFTAMGARKIGDDLGVDWSKIDLEQFRAGLGVELEHGLRDPQTNVTNDDPALTGKIAWAHLKELPDYYTRLKQVEEKMSSSTPGITRLNVDAELDTVRAAKIRDWSTKYPLELIQRATRLADEWAAGLAQTYFPDDLELQRKFVEKNYSKGLGSADKWLQGVTK